MSDKPKRGRPSLKSPERVGVILDALKSAMPVKRACEFARINPDTFYQWLKKDENLSVEVGYAKSHAIRALIASTAKKDPWKLLKNLDSEHFKDNMEVSVEPTREFLIEAADRQRKLIR